ncbi:MAG TPA: FecR domain-containing protein [Chitinophagaceae bacterium]|nr:FecR domain-containing protein [Chitinophagaceae bacterium]
MTEEQLTGLIQKYLSGEATEEEKIKVEQWYESFEANSLRFMSGEAKGTDMSATRSLDAIKKKIAQKQAESRESAPVSKTKVIHFWRVAAAVAVLILFSGTIYFLSHSSNKRSTVPLVSVKNDIQPGGNKAILTLGNGTKIVLDSTNTGILSIQGNTKIVKLNGGQLAYNPDPSATPGVTSRDKVQSKVQYNTITTPRGGQYEVRLPDGSKVWLNAASSLRFPTAFTGMDREVQVTGEAYFEIAKKANQPFKVSVKGMIVNVLGTHFNVMAYDNEPVIKTTLLEGSVKITQGDKNLILKPGQEAQLNQNDGLELIKDVNVDEAVAWKNHLFWFDNDDIQSIMRQLSRWYDADVVIEGKIPDLFTGSIPRDVPVSKIFEVLEKTGSIRYKIENGKIIVSP